ncbi:hypothetical protein RSOLAG22IIIB_02181 [Rhizoctonia solani]|uniref:Uncharacterized protein n=1 Tax=Rhizoctonia solani TaxID=456999 RepID=A0A0K6GDL5_9AGAM|nr:hypothetical protein RSOLAG22IIIB_02181 [Rhizoctonia solani]
MNLDGKPYILMVRKRGSAVYDPERVACMTEDPPVQLIGRKIEEIPLFMRKRLPLNFPDNSHLPIHGVEELYEGVALRLKNRGNLHFKAHRWWNAREDYLDALAIQPSDTRLREALWLNVAAANVELEYWPGVLSSAARAITLNFKPVKAYYRAARALMYYKQYEEAIDCCTRVLAFDPQNEAILEMMEDPKLGGSVTKQTKVDAARQALEKAYKDKRFIVLRTQPLKLDPKNFPYICPAIPNNRRFDMYCNINFKFPERNALDVFIRFKTSTHIQQLLSNALPGPDHPVIKWSFDPDFDPLDTTSEHARLVKLHAERIIMDPSVRTHPRWDPTYRYLPHNVSVYLETYNRRALKVEYAHTIDQVIQMVAEKPEDRVCLEGGSIVFSVFRPGSKAEKLWLEGKGRKGVALAHPKYKQTDKRAMLASGQIRGWLQASPRDILEYISVAARSEMLSGEQVVRDRA